RREVGVLVGRRQHADLMAETDQRLGQVHDVVLHAAGHVEGIGRDHPDPHSSPYSHSFWSMCQSCGLAAMPAAYASASAWVVCLTRTSSGPSVGGTTRRRTATVRVG